MKKNLIVFILLFAVGAAAGLAVRATRHQPYARTSLPVPPAKVDAHAASTASAGVVNTTCPICGMNVDPHIPPTEYQGNLIGFGCPACPPRFAKDPDRWGPAALQNRVAE